LSRSELSDFSFGGAGPEIAEFTIAGKTADAERRYDTANIEEVPCHTVRLAQSGGGQCWSVGLLIAALLMLAKAAEVQVGVGQPCHPRWPGEIRASAINQAGSLRTSRPLLAFAGLWTVWTSVRKAKEGEITADRPFIDDRGPGFARLPDFRQVAAGQDGQEAWCHPSIKAGPAAAGKSSYRLGPERFRPLPIAGVDKSLDYPVLR
jgi:hypothetical protein